MAVTIDDLDVQTKPLAGPSNALAATVGQWPKQDVKAELEKLHERELRLQAN